MKVKLPNSNDKEVKMSDGLTSEQLYEELNAFTRELVNAALTYPVSALPKIEQYRRAYVETTGADYESIHLLHFLAYATLANQLQQAEEPSVEDVRKKCEKAVAEYQCAEELSKHKEDETYQEEVVIRPGSLFRKAQTVMQTRTRRVVRSRTDMTGFDGPIDGILLLLELCSPARVHEVSGEGKVRYLFAANRVIWPPIMDGALENGTISKEVKLAIGELPLKGTGPIRAAAVSWQGDGSEPKLLFSLFDQPPTKSLKAHYVGACKVQKSKGKWHLYPVTWTSDC